jgi:hypothetical protein
MSEFAQSAGQFKNGWRNNESRRRAFLGRLVQIIVDYVQCWIGAAIFRSDYDKADAIYQAHEFLQPYSFSCIACVELALEWRRVHKLDYLPMEFVFESGDEPWGQFHDRMVEDYEQAPLTRTKEQATPLQVADFAAYEIRKAYVGLDEGSDELFKHFRTSLGMLVVNVPHKWGHYAEEAIRTLMNVRGVPKR